MKALLIVLTVLCSGCISSFKSPMTQIEWTGEISERGLSATMKPPFWGWCVQAYKFMVSD